MNELVELRRYLTESGRDIFGEWLSGLRDLRTRAKIVARLDRLSVGNFGDCKALRGGLSELRINWGPGYRVYYAFVGRACVLLLCGGDKGKTAIGYQARAGISQRLQGEDSMKREASVSHDDATVRELRDNPEFAAEYLRAALEDDDEPGVLLIALRRIAEARGGIAKVAKAAGVERESLYRALSARGNPRFSTLVAVTKAVGLRLTVEAEQ
jgi:putative addiction module killer protein/probable addiction module antidote protein